MIYAEMENIDPNISLDVQVIGLLQHVFTATHTEKSAVDPASVLIWVLILVVVVVGITGGYCLYRKKSSSLLDAA